MISSSCPTSGEIRFVSDKQRIYIHVEILNLESQRQL
jgi:hypothetical protein